MYPFIAVEGPIGVGKTSLAKEIAHHFRYDLLEEIVEKNPFLSQFYEDIEAWSFQTEMFFLCNRYKQLSDMKKEAKKVVADYHIFKNLIFTKRTLQEDEYKKFLKIYDVLIEDMPMPNIVIYLHASEETLIQRIQKRGRAFEQGMDIDYLRQLMKDYEQFMGKFEELHPEVPVLRLNGDQLDFVKNESHLQYVIQQVEEAIDIE